MNVSRFQVNSGGVKLDILNSKFGDWTRSVILPVGAYPEVLEGEARSLSKDNEEASGLIRHR